MKRSIVLFVLLSAFVVGVCMVNAACGASLSRTESDDVLDGIQKKNELAMNNCFVQNTAAPLDSLFTKLNKRKHSINSPFHSKNVILLL